MVGFLAKLPSDDSHSQSVRYPPLTMILQCESVFQLLMHLGARVVTCGISEEDLPPGISPRLSGKHLSICWIVSNIPETQCRLPCCIKEFKDFYYLLVYG